MIGIFKNVRILIWDFDGTFYKPIPPLWKKIREAEYLTIKNYTGWQMAKVIIEFDKLHKKVLHSATACVAQLSSISTGQAAVEMEKYFDRRKFLKRDPKLIKLFQKLSNFGYYILANGSIRGITDTLKKLGIDRKIFREIITSEIVGVTKPDNNGFKYILSKTNLPPGSHLMIGDRENVDLVPAKKLGIKTCLVFSSTKSEIADLSLPSVYDLEKYLV